MPTEPRDLHIAPPPTGLEQCSDPDLCTFGAHFTESEISTLPTVGLLPSFRKVRAGGGWKTVQVTPAEVFARLLFPRGDARRQQ